MQKLLFRRVLRDFRHNLPRYAALFSLMLLSMFLVVSLMGAADSIIQGTAESAEAHGVEHGQFGVFVPLTDSETAQIEASGVTLQKDFSLDLHLDADGSTLRVYAYRDTIDRFAATTGAETVQPGEILLEQHYADTHGFVLGSTVTLGGKAFTVAGIGSTPDYDAVFEKVTSTAADPKQFGVGFVCAADYDALNDAGAAFRAEDYTYTYRLVGDATDDSLKALLQSFTLDRSKVTDTYFLDYVTRAEQTRTDLQDALTALADGAGELTDGMDELTGYSADLNDAADALFDAMLTQAEESLAQAGITVQLTAENYAAQLEKLADDPSTSAALKQTLADAAGQLDALEQFRQGVHQYTEGASQAAAGGSTQLRDGVQELQNAADDILDEYFSFDLDNLTQFLPAAENPRIGGAADDVEINLYGSGAAGVILMILFTYVISVFVVHTIEQESSIIGALYAMGVTRNQLLVHYLAAPVVVSWLGGVCGLLLSLTPIGCVQQMQDTYLYYSLPQLGVRLPGLLLVYALVMPPVIAAAVNCIVIRKSLSRTALSLLRSEQKASHASRISRIDLGHLSFLPRFQLRQLLRELRSAFAVLGGMFICLLVLMIALDCYVYCDNFNRRSILETTYEYCYTYKYPTEEVPEGGTPAYAETLRQTSYGYDLDVTMLGIDPGCPYFPEVAPTAKKSEVVIASSVAQKFGVGKGDVLVLRDEVNDVNYAFTVTDVVHYASGLYIFMDRDAMQELFGRGDDYYNTVFSDHALDIDTGLLYATVSRQNIEQASAVFTDLMMPMVILVSVLSVIIFLVVLYLMIKVMIDRASYSISLLKVFGYRTGEVRRLYLDGNFVVVALGALVCIPAAKGLMDVIYPYFVSNVAAGQELSFPPQLYAVIYAGVLACYLLIDLVLVRRLDRMTPAEVLKNRE